MTSLLLPIYVPKISQIMIWLIRNFTSVIKYLIYRSRFPLSNLFIFPLRQNILLPKSSYIVLDLARGTIFVFQYICSAHDFHFMYTKTNWWSNHFAKYILLINNEYTFIRVFYNIIQYRGVKKWNIAFCGAKRGKFARILPKISREFAF